MKHTFTIALVGNPNCGKTTLFNLLTKSGEPVGNRAGVTFSAKKEPLRKFSKNEAVWIMDLPGIHSLSPHGNEEKAALRALQTERVDVILNVLDATNLEHGLSLTLSLLSLGIPTVAALNMMDEAKKEGLVLNASALENALGIPVFPISAAKNIGIDALVQGCVKARQIPVPLIFSNRAEAAEIIHSILEQAIRKKGRASTYSDRLDTFICHPAVGIPLFFLIMSLVFWLTFSSVGGSASAWLEYAFAQISMLLKNTMRHFGVSDWLCRFLTDGVWMGVSAVLAFIPQTAILFFLLAALEDSGYLARAAFVMDDVMRRFGVSGKAIIPLLIGFGCTVPAVMATATLDDTEKETAIAALPFIPCNARLPVIMLIASAFFDDHTALFAIALYFLCIGAALLSIALFQKKSEKQAPPLILELPKYRIPRSVSLFREVKNKLKDFLVRAGTVVFLSCVIVDLLAMLTPGLRPVANSGESILSHIGEWIAPLFSFLGFADGRMVAALAAGFFAKESIVSTVQILIPEGLPAAVSKAGAFSFAVFSLLYVPCAATLSAAKQELGAKKALFILCRTLVLATILTFLAYTGFRFLSK